MRINTSTGSRMGTVSLAGTEQQFWCAPGDTLLRAALRAGLGIAYECNSGACGICKVELISGQVADLYPDAPGIKQRDRDRRRCLACQSVPTGDCQIKARTANMYVPRHIPTPSVAFLEQTRQITHDIREFTFRTDQSALFLAGQYAMLKLARHNLQRAYSMSNTANEDGIWKFMIRRTPTGAMSTALFDLDVGSSVEIDGPFGQAYLREDSARDIVCIAGGSGIAPMLSILEAAKDHMHLRKLGAWLFYGGRGPADIPAITDLLSSHHLEHGLQWHPVVSVPTLAKGTDWSGDFGFVHELLPKRLPRPLVEYEFYLAGPPPMVEAVVGLLASDNKVPFEQLHFDRFF